VRCLASVLSFCGIPTTMADGKTPMFRDVNSTRKIASEAVKNVYAYVGSPRDTAYLDGLGFRISAGASKARSTG